MLMLIYTMPVSHENIQLESTPQFPAVEGLSDAAYLAEAQKFGHDWQAFVDGKQEFLAGMESVASVLAERSAALAAIPVNERAATLIESYRTTANDLLQTHGQEPLHTSPLTPELMEAANVSVVEVRQGVPAVLTNGRHTDALFGTQSTNFSTGLLNEAAGALPFVVLQDTRASHPEWFDVNRRHETAHTIWAITRDQMGVAAPTTNEQAAFLHAQDEGIAFATAGQRQFLHAANVQELQAAHMDQTIEDYRAIDASYRASVSQLEPSAAVLGIATARTMDDLRSTMDRLRAAAEHVAPSPATVAAVGTSAIGGWGTV
jgi:hypothetical protein